MITVNQSIFLIVTAAKLISSSIATCGIIGVGIGTGILFGAYLISVSRNPQMKSELFTMLILGFALTEAMALFSLLMSFLLLFIF